MLDFQMEQDIAVTVEGDLNPQELADIKSLISDLGTMFKEFLASGRPGVAGDRRRVCQAAPLSRASRRNSSTAPASGT